MVKKRKPVQPRKTVRRPITRIHVVGWGRGLGWNIKVDGRRVGTFYRQMDAELIAKLLAKTMVAASLRFHKADGTIKEERTYGVGAETPKPG